MKSNYGFLLTILLIGVIFISGCISSGTSKNTLKDRYEQYSEDIRHDNLYLDTPLYEWKILMGQRNNDGTYDGSTYDINDLIKVQREYTDNANTLQTKIDAFRSFMNQNQDELKEAGIYTSEKKQYLDNLSAEIRSNILLMQTEIDKMSKH